MAPDSDRLTRWYPAGQLEQYVDEHKSIANPTTTQSPGLDHLGVGASYLGIKYLSPHLADIIEINDFCVL